MWLWKEPGTHLIDGSMTINTHVHTCDNVTQHSRKKTETKMARLHKVYTRMHRYIKTSFIYTSMHECCCWKSKYSNICLKIFWILTDFKSIWTTSYSPYDGCKLESIKSAINRSPFADKYKPSTELMLALLSTRVHRRHPNDIGLKTKKHEHCKRF